MKKTTITVEGEIQLEYDENSIEFQNALASYKEICDENADAEDLIKNVCHNLIRFGEERMIEGAGYVKPRHISWDKVPTPHTGIELTTDVDYMDFHFTIE